MGSAPPRSPSAKRRSAPAIPSPSWRPSSRRAGRAPPKCSGCSTTRRGTRRWRRRARVDPLGRRRPPPSGMGTGDARARRPRCHRDRGRRREDHRRPARVPARRDRAGGPVPTRARRKRQHLRVTPSKAEQADATRTALVAVARRLFTERGYAATSTNEIVERAGVTRGALYHHFSTKDELFRAVFEQLEEEVTKHVAQEALRGADPLEQLRHGSRAYL